LRPENQKVLVATRMSLISQVIWYYRSSISNTFPGKNRFTILLLLSY